MVWTERDCSAPEEKERESQKQTLAMSAHKGQDFKQRKDRI